MTPAYWYAKEIAWGMLAVGIASMLALADTSVFAPRPLAAHRNPHGT